MMSFILLKLDCFDVRHCIIIGMDFNKMNNNILGFQFFLRSDQRYQVEGQTFRQTAKQTFKKVQPINRQKNRETERQI